MGLNTFVYISDVDNLSDARYTAGMGVSLIGFRLNPNDESALDASQFKEISEWISGVKLVGEFGELTPEELETALTQFEIDYLLISDASMVHEYSRLGKPLILKIIINEETKKDLATVLNYCSGAVDYFLLESSQDVVDENSLAMIKKYASQFPVLLGYGIHTHNALTMAKELKLAGISLKGSSEIRPGYKDFDEMADILEVLEVD